MTDRRDRAAVARFGAPAARLFGWIMLAALAAFLVNNVLTVGFGLPGASAAFKGGGAAWLQAALYAAGGGVAAFYVLRTPETALRRDADLIHRFNLYLVRACFWIVLLVGVADAVIAFARVEALFAGLLDEEAIRSLGRSRWVGWNVHAPLSLAGAAIAIFSRAPGFDWLALLIVAAELAIVITRFVFSYEQALMGDLVRYWYAALFLFASAYTLFDEGHVRVDVLYAGFGRAARGYVNAFGAVLLGMTTCWVIIAVGFDGKQSIINSPVANFEITQTGGVGMFIKYHMAVFLGVFAITMLVQFVSYYLEAVADCRNEPGGREPTAH